MTEGRYDREDEGIGRRWMVGRGKEEMEGKEEAGQKGVDERNWRRRRRKGTRMKGWTRR